LHTGRAQHITVFPVEYDMRSNAHIMTSDRRD